MVVSRQERSAAVGYAQNLLDRRAQLRSERRRLQLLLLIPRRAFS